MRNALFATAAVLLAFGSLPGGPAIAQEQPQQQPQAQPQELPQEQPAAEDPTGNSPDSDTAASTTGGVTSHARENLPDVGDGEAIDAERLQQAAPASGQSGANSGVVSEAMVKELHQMGLEQQHKAAKAEEPESEESKQAKQKAIAAHAENLFSRVEERS